jgi:hypothetical protein
MGAPWAGSTLAAQGEAFGVPPWAVFHGSAAPLLYEVAHGAEFAEIVMALFLCD